MCEILLRVVDVVHVGDAAKNARASHRGDVIVVSPNGWPWGTDELAMSFWRILKLPNITENEASVLLAPERNTDPLNPSPTLQRRAFKLNIDDVTLPPSLRNYIADDTRAQPFFTSTLTFAQVQPFILKKDPIVIA